MFPPIPSYETDLSPRTTLCDIHETSYRWRIVLTLPSRPEPSERIAALEWLRSYRTTMNSEHPMWWTRIYDTSSGYFLDVWRASDLDDKLRKGFHSIQMHSQEGYHGAWRDPRAVDART